jgi:hypothetical protein
MQTLTHSGRIYPVFSALLRNSSHSGFAQWEIFSCFPVADARAHPEMVFVPPYFIYRRSLNG